MEEKEKKPFNYSKITMIFVGIMTIFIAVLVINVLPLIKQAKGLATQANALLVQAESSISDIDEAANAFAKTADDLSAFVDNEGAQMTEAITSLAEIDIEGMNNSIENLEAVSSSMARLFGRK